MIQNPTISVIVPVYNAEKFLHKCIDSILAQTFTDFELLLINDGSKDNSGQICDEYAKKDTRIKVFNKENGGVSSARNMGINNSKGNWIAFVDSDDWIEREYLNMFFIDGIPPNDTLVIQNILHETNSGQYPKCNFDNLSIAKEHISDLFSKYEIIKYGYPFCKLYNTSILYIHQIQFNLKISYGEDLLFFLEYLKYVDSIRLIREPLYHYVSSDGISLSKKYFSFDSELLLFSLTRKQIRSLSILFHFDEKGYLLCNQRLALFYSRCLASIFRKENSYTKETRLLLLEKIYNLSFNPLLFKSRIFTPFKPAVFFVQKKRFKFCNIYLCFLFFLRHTLNDLWNKIR